MNMIFWRIAIFAIGLFASGIAHSQDNNWTYPPVYESPLNDTDVSFPFGDGLVSHLYDESYAVLIFQGNYFSPMTRTGRKAGPTAPQAWSSPEEVARVIENSMVPALEARRFRVLVWRDLDSRALRTVPEEAIRNLGANNNSRFLFFYFGHGTTVGTMGGRTVFNSTWYLQTLRHQPMKKNSPIKLFLGQYY